MNITAVVAIHCDLEKIDYDDHDSDPSHFEALLNDAS